MTDQKKLKRSFNRCYHEKGELLSIATNTSKHEYDTSGIFWDHVDVGSQLWHLSGNPALHRARQLVKTDAGGYPGELIAFYMQRAIKKPPEVLSLVNFLWELREFKQLFKLWTPKFGLLHNIASTRLGYKYGWELFLNDCIAILVSLFTLKKRVNKFLDGMGKVKQGRYRVRLADNDRGEVLGVTLNSQEAYGNLRDPGFPDFHASYDMLWASKEAYEVANIRYSYWIPEASAFHAQLGFLLHAFGVEWNARVIWDAIPYSFIMDWFISVGDFIESWASHPNVPVHVRVHDSRSQDRVK